MFGWTLKDARNVACWTVPLAIPVCVTRKWKKMINKLRRWWSQRLSRSILLPSLPIRWSDEVVEAWQTTACHARQRWRAYTQYLTEMEGFELLFSAVPSWDPLLKELALQVSESDSQISISLHAHTTKTLSRYVHLLYPSSFIQFCTNFVGAFTFQSARSGLITRHILASYVSATALYRFTSLKTFVLLQAV